MYRAFINRIEELELYSEKDYKRFKTNDVRLKKLEEEVLEKEYEFPIDFYIRKYYELHEYEEPKKLKLWEQVKQIKKLLNISESHTQAKTELVMKKIQNDKLVRKVKASRKR